jgi:hypothetical protein
VSFNKALKREAQRAKREAQRAARVSFATLTPLPERPESLLAAAYQAVIVTVDLKTKEVLAISPRAAIPHRANQ